MYQVNTNYYSDDEWIVDILNLTHSKVKDVNKDGTINCIDYAITFKREWDKKYPSNLCGIMRNYNRQTGWNHLFVSVRGTSRAKWINVEPQGKKNNYKMSEYWGEKYDPTYNYYDETEKWLKMFP